MTTIQGTDQAYDSIAGNYLYLSLTNGDTLFGTDFAPINGYQLDGGINYVNLVKSMKLIDGEETNKDILTKYINMNNSINLKPEPVKDNNSIYSVISKIPQLYKIKQIIDSVGYNEILSTGNADDKKTFFAPVNEAVNVALESWLKPEKAIYTPQPYTFKNIPSEQGIPNIKMKNLLKAHTLGFELDLDSVINRKLELYTLDDPFSFIIDGTAKVKPYLNVYQKPLYLKNYEYPLNLDRFKILKIFQCSNGTIYIIDNMFSPQM